ncbi:hypothetical protein MNBD_GAMMA12-3616 [hydrothermal vent metagenome]|uniref:TauD/TfdA-like domain-containing protein n=1 Tax=hydrothermal vent metagenome TaxID=652676 RepID=A0A3B0Y743_9ZZZZ
MPIYKRNETIQAFDLKQTKAYEAWCSQKFDNYPQDIKEITVEVKNSVQLSASEKQAIQTICYKTNLAIVRIKKNFPDKNELKQFGVQLGLNSLDNNLCADEEAISSIRVRKDSLKHEGYIPYTAKALNWHTDGYYNLETKKINAILMYCAEKSATGGNNRFLDHEIIYCQLRNLNPEFIRVLELPDVMTIPANVVDGIEIRAAQTGPVFSINPVTERLHMRYSARKRNIIWKDEPMVHEAIKAIEALLNEPNDYIFNYTPLPGQLIISNNALHSRASFEDKPEQGLQRVIYRARYLERISNT